jgi:hypothetical protein
VVTDEIGGAVKALAGRQRLRCNILEGTVRGQSGKGNAVAVTVAGTLTNFGDLPAKERAHTVEGPPEHSVEPGGNSS